MEGVEFILFVFKIARQRKRVPPNRNYRNHYLLDIEDFPIPDPNLPASILKDMLLSLQQSLHLEMATRLTKTDNIQRIKHFD